MKRILFSNKFSNILFGLLFMSFSFSQNQRFTKLSSQETDIHFRNVIKDTETSNILIYSNFYAGAGVGVGDFNNDGLEDIFFAGNIVHDRLYFNRGNFHFEDVTKKTGILQDKGWSTGVSIADVNNDGYLDIYVSRELYDDDSDRRRNLLYINQGNGTFKEKAKQYNLANKQRTRHTCFFDYNKDGFLDIILLIQPPNPGSYSPYSGSDLSKYKYHLKLLKNTGNNYFIDVSKASKIDKTAFPNAVSASDLNNDGWPDLYVTNDFEAPDFVFINNHDGTFTDKSHSVLNHMSFYSMGLDVSDINNDGLLDIFVLDMAAESNFRSKSNMSGMNPKAFWKVVNGGGHYQYMYNNFQLNNGNGTFSDVAQITNMATTDWSWSSLIADFDNDGFKDVYITNGLLRDIRNKDADKAVSDFINKTVYDWVQKNPDGGGVKRIWEVLDVDKVIPKIPSEPIANYAFKNKGGLKFSNVSDKWGFVQKTFSNGSSYADFDNDGDLDLVVSNVNEEAFLYRNNTKDNNYFRIKLKSRKNLPTFGTKVKIVSHSGKQFFETTNVRGMYSTSENHVHFGLGKDVKVDSLKIIWTNGKVSKMNNLKVNQDLIVYMDDAKNNYKELKTKRKKIFKNITTNFSLKHRHKENIFNDYAYQVLLPHKMSQFGPALLTGDFNGDEIDDVFIGGATGHPATLYIQKSNSFEKSNVELWKTDAKYEDVDATLVDIDNDGDLDIYVVSGGNEFEAYDSLYRDRIYINDGQGTFKRGDIQGLNNISGSLVKASDFDKDGDIDLFVGGRLKPRKYPEAVSSMLLLNNKGHLENKTPIIANELINLGMVTDAIWSDYDSDGWDDLIVVGEWMPITIFKNNKGYLVKQNIQTLKHSKGWWFSIDQGDFDNDGDLDYLVGNLGLNYKYKTSSKAPFDLYYKDFDKNGSKDIVLAYYQKNNHYPLRGFSCSSQQIPEIKQKFKKYDLFASLKLDEVYGSKKLQKSLHYTVDTFASIYVENLGKGIFKTSLLPRMAQLSNINDFLVNDYNGDGHLDALTVGNLFESEIETPRNDAGTGAFLLGDGKGGFEVKRSAESGFFANKNAKKIAPIKFQEEKIIIITNNNDSIQAYKVLPID